MKISARITNSAHQHAVVLETAGKSHTIHIPPQSSGFGSSANGGELLFLALATCYGNDIYREAAARNINVTAVEVTVNGEFGGRGDPAQQVTYSATVTAEASEDEIRQLMVDTDLVAEVQNTLRQMNTVTLAETRAISLRG